MCDGIDALIFARLNPGSVAVAKGLGMHRHGQISMSDFLPDADLGRDVLECELRRVSAVLSRRDRPLLPETDIIRELEIAFDAGLADPVLDIFRIERC
jgi:hypothetical protein